MISHFVFPQMHLIPLLILATFLCNVKGQADYCKIKCRNGFTKEVTEHTMCKYKVSIYASSALREI